MSAENPTSGGKSVSGGIETPATQEKPEVAEETEVEKLDEPAAPPLEDTSARDAEKLDAVRERLGLPKENVGEQVSEAWKEKLDYYLDNLGVSRSDIHGDILDVGGYEGEFAALVKANDLPANVRILEPIATPYYAELEKDYVRNDAREMKDIEDESVDLLLAHASVPNTFMDVENDHMADDINRTLDEAVRVLKRGGRARFGPIEFGDEYPIQQAFRDAIEKAVARVGDTEGIKAEIVSNGETPTIDESNGERREIMVPNFYISIEKEMPRDNGGEAVDPEAWKETDWVDEEGEKISIADVIEYLGDETVEFNVQELLKQLPRLLKTEPDRLEKANPEHPIIIVRQGGTLKYVLDGNHRLSKAVATGMENIKAKILDLDKPETPQKFVKMFGRA